MSPNQESGAPKQLTSLSARPLLTNLAHATLPALGATAGVTLARTGWRTRNLGTGILAAGVGAALGLTANRIYTKNYRRDQGQYLPVLGGVAGGLIGLASAPKSMRSQAAFVGAGLGAVTSNLARQQIASSLYERDKEKFKPVLSSVVGGLVGKFAPIIPGSVKDRATASLADKAADVAYRPFKQSKDLEDELQFKARDIGSKFGINVPRPRLSTPTLTGTLVSTGIVVPFAVAGGLHGLQSGLSSVDRLVRTPLGSNLAANPATLQTMKRMFATRDAVIGSLVGGGLGVLTYKAGRWLYNNSGINPRPYRPPKNDPVTTIAPSVATLGITGALGSAILTRNVNPRTMAGVGVASGLTGGALAYLLQSLKQS